MLRHVSALVVGHLKGARNYFDLCSLCMNLNCSSSTCMITIIVMKIKYNNS